MKKNLSLIGFLFIINSAAKAQCGVCTVNINDIDTSSYNLTVGQVLCIDSNGVVKGNVILNGGVICNKGIFKPENFTCTLGEITNNGNMSFPGAITLSTGSILNNGVSSVINFAGTLTISGANFMNNGVMNIETNIQNNSGTVLNNSIINCQQVLGAGTLTNNGVINSN